MKPVPPHLQKSLDDDSLGWSAQILKNTFGRHEFRRTIILIPELPYPLPRQRRGRWASYDVYPLSAGALGATVIRSGRGSEHIIGCLTSIKNALKDTLWNHRYVFFGEGMALSDDPKPVASITPASYWLADPLEFIHDRLSILYRQTYMGDTPERLGGTLLTAPAVDNWHARTDFPKIEAELLIDNSAFWFTAFMNANGIREYSVQIVPVHPVQVSPEAAQSNALRLARVLKNELERVRVGVGAELAPSKN